MILVDLECVCIICVCALNTEATFRSPAQLGLIMIIDAVKGLFNNLSRVIKSCDFIMVMIYPIS